MHTNKSAKYAYCFWVTTEHYHHASALLIRGAREENKKKNLNLYFYKEFLLITCKGFKYHINKKQKSKVFIWMTWNFFKLRNGLEG